MNIVQALDDPRIFRSVIKGHSTWGVWRGFLKALFGLPMDEAEAAMFRDCTKRETLPTSVFGAAWLVCGRRGGKSFALALIAVFLACFKDYTPHLAMGERATIVIIAADRKQARVIFRYVRGIMDAVPALRALVEGETAEELRLKTPVNIEVMTASSRTVRGYAIPVALLDEVAFWSVEGASDADTDIIGALRQAMKQFPGAMLLGASSPYARRGALWENYKAHHGQDASRTLVWQAATWRMNPTISRADLEPEFQADPARAAAEYEALFRTDVETFVSREVVEDAVVEKRYELPPVAGISYTAFVDPSGGSVDSMTLGIAHAEKDGRAVLDAIRVRKPPFSPEAVVGEFCDLLKAYGVRKVTGDRYAGEFAREPFRKAGISYELTDRLSASDVFRECLPLLNSGKVELLDHPRLQAELIALERRTSRNGKDNIGHPPSGHDDIAVAACGALLLASGVKAPLVITDEMIARASKPPPGGRLPRGARPLGFRPRFGGFR